MIRDFRELSKKDLLLAGGKGANLGELTRAGMPVPPGFVITTTAYDRFVNQNALGKIITNNIQDESNDGATIRDAFIKAPIPKDVERITLKAYRELGKGSVAVRSSATAEDLPSAAFAGQQETYLNIVGEKEFLDAVQRTWASLWTERAISYRTRQEIDQKKVKIAVVVQRMIDAEFAGVMFTANPVTGNREEIVIDANPGLGEAIVSGLTTPDHFVMRQQWWRWSVVEKIQGRREIIIKSKIGGGTKRVEKSDDDSELPPKTLIRLAKLGAKIGHYFKNPQDIEWVWAEAKIFIVQSRPITALPDILPKRNRFSRMLAGIVAEVMPKRPYPLEATTFGFELLINNFLGPFFRSIGFNIQAVDKLFIEEDGILLRYSGQWRFRPTLAILLAPFRLLRLTIHYNPSHWESDPLVSGIIKKVKALEGKNYKECSSKELIDTIRETLEIFPTIFEIRFRYLLRVALAVIGLRLMLLLSGRKDLLGTLLYLGIETKVTETNQALANLAAKIRREKTLAEIFQINRTENLISQLESTKIGRSFLAEFQDFLDVYGYRESGGTLLISQPTWKESPETVLGILKGLTYTSTSTKSKFTWEDARDTLIAQSILRFSPLKSFFLKFLEIARHLHEIREDTRFYMMMPIPTLRRAIFEIGDRLTEAQIFSEPQEIFYLKLDELEKVVRTSPQTDKIRELKTLLSQRKAKYAELKTTPFVDPRLYRIIEGKGEALLVGTPGSPGVAEGTARVIHDSSEFDTLRPGDVLIAPYTNPAWTPLFERASGVVVDTGSVMSHAAIVAREYGIPAVMGTVDGTKKIRNDDKIRVDGTNGQVFASNLSIN